MTSAAIVVLCLAYISGLLATAFPWGGLVVLVLGVTIALAVQLKAPGYLRSRKAGLKPAIWLAAGAIAFLASLYLQLREPQPAANDISRFVAPPSEANPEQVVNVVGKVATRPRLTRSQKIQFLLNTTQVTEIVGSPSVTGTDTAKTKTVSGKLYVTVPLLQGTGVYPGQRVEVKGKLYLPKPAANPGGFDFQAYLAREGTFAGLAGESLNFPAGNTSEKLGLWQLRRRIVRAQIRWLGVPEGPLLSAMVLGRRAVDLPYEIRDRFIQVGLAHVLAASGFHVAVILGLVRVLTKRFSDRAQFGDGAAVLIAYVAVTGGSASVFRAAIMGFGGLIAPLMQRKVNALGSLLVAAGILLMINPLWIWDLGFQLSFFATLGLLVSAPPIMKGLDWMPPAIASLIAVPIAASIWVLPLLLYTFGIISPYSILLNAILALPLAGITLVGFISAIAGAIWPLAGSALAWLIYYPLKFLLAIVEFFSQLPGNSVATGTLSSVQVVMLYALIVMVWLIPGLHRQKRWLWAFFFAVGLVVVPVLHTRTTVFQVTALATRGEPVLVIQDKSKVTVINTGDDNTARYVVLPFLRQQGVNAIDWAIATDRVDESNGWHLILDNLNIRTFSSPAMPTEDLSDRTLLTHVIERKGAYQPLPMGQAVEFGSIGVQLVSLTPQVVQFQIRDQSWVLLEDLNPSEQNQLVTTGNLAGTMENSALRVLWWSGKQLTPYLLEALQPQVAIASGDEIDPETASALIAANAQIYAIARDGALQWRGGEFTPTLDDTENENLML